MKVTVLAAICNICCVLAQPIGHQMSITWKDSIWIFFVLLLNVAYFSRKVILALHGYGISFIDFGKDFTRIREIALKSNKKRQIIFNVINYLVPVSFVLGLALCIWVRFL